MEVDKIAAKPSGATRTE